MKTKINIVIVVSVIALIALSAIQYSLIENTFRLQRDLFFKEAKKELSFIEMNSSDDAWDEMYLKALKRIGNDYQKGLVSKEKFLWQFSKSRDSINKKFNTHFNKELAKRKLLFPIKYQQNITNVVIFNNLKTDTVLSVKENPLLLFGVELNNKTKKAFNTGEWTSSNSSKDDGQISQNLGFKIATQSYVDVPNWRTVVFKRMIWVLFASVVSILTVISLFVYALFALIKQKKNADIKTDFVNNITHELKTPLATLSIAVKTLQKEKVQEHKEVLQNTINTIDRQRIRLQKLIDQVVNNSLGFEQIQLQKETLNGNIWLTNLINDYKLQETNVVINTALPIQNFKLSIDKFHINTALLNLLDNAVKYGAKNIAIHCNIENDNFQILTEDDGIGIASKHQQKIFDKFYRVENNTIHNVKGLGLGLYYVNQIIKAHNGNIVLESKLEKGTSIKITIPTV